MKRFELLTEQVEGLNLSGEEEESVVVIWVDRNMLAGSRQSLCDANDNDENVYVLGSKVFSRETLGLLFLLQNIVSRPWLGTIDNVKNLNDQQFQQMMFYRRVEDDDDEPPEEIVKMFIEPVTSVSDDVVLGWRFYYVGLTAEFDFNRGISNFLYLCKNARRKKNPTAGWRKYTHRLESQYDVIEQLISPACGNILLKKDARTKKDVARAYATSLSDPANPFRVEKLFDLERAVSLTPRDAKPEFSTNRNLNRLPCKYVLPTSRRPDNVWKALLVAGVSDYDWRRGMDDEMALKIMARGNDWAEALEGNVYRKVKEANDRELMVSLDLRETRESQTFLERFLQVAASGEDPGYEKIFAWFENQRKTALDERRVFTVVHPKNMCMDDTLSHFGNEIAKITFIFEEVFKVVAYHPEILFAHLNSHGVYHRSEEMYLHYIIAGVMASGKSFLLQMMSYLRIEGTTVEVSHETERAYNTDSNQNYELHTYDEMPSRYFDEQNGGGNQTMKELLTRNKLQTKTIKIDEDTKERSTIQCNLEHHCMMYGATNDPLNQMPDPMKDRFHIVSVPAFERDEKNPAFLSIMKNIDSKVSKDIKFEFHLTQALVCFVQIWIDLGLLPDVDLTVTKVIIPMFLTHLQKKGVTLLPRPSARILSYVRTVTVWYAVRQVFFTDCVFQGGEEFDWRQLYEVAPYLVATEEIVWFALSSMQTAFEDPNEQVVFEAITKMTDWRDENGDGDENGENVLAEMKRAAEVHASCRTSSGCNVVDWNYVYVNTSHEDAGKGRLKAAAEKIAREIKQKSFMRLSVENVVDTLCSLYGQTRSVKTYLDSPNEANGPATHLPIIKMVNGAEGKTGVAFLKQYMNECLGRNEPLVLEAIKKTFHSQTKPRRVILGLSHRNGHESLRNDPVNRDRMFPHLMQTMEVVPNPSIHAYMINEKFKTFGFDEAIKDTPTVCDERPFVRVDCDFESYNFSKHTENVQWNKEVKFKRYDDPKTSGKYPDIYVAHHLRTFDRRDHQNLSGAPRDESFVANTDDYEENARNRKKRKTMRVY